MPAPFSGSGHCRAGRTNEPSRRVPVSPLLHARERVKDSIMPSLFRFLAMIGVVGGVAYGAMFLLATWFNPQPREITVSIPPDRYARQP
jgi:hypothetical protein